MANIIAPNTTADIYFTPFKEYVALLSQSNTDAPVATVMNSNDSNYLGDIVWTRNGVGDYIGTLTGALTVGKTVFFYTNNISNTGVPIIGFLNDVNSFGINTYNSGGTISDNQLEDTPLEIRVYP